MSDISYRIGDATYPEGDGPKIIAHICNDVGAWGKGFVMALSKRWAEPEKSYRLGRRSPLGTIDVVQVETGLFVVNMIAQHGLYAENGTPPIRYDALDRCLKVMGIHALMLGASVHMPRIGCGLAGGTWDKVEPIIQRRLVAEGVPVTVYDLK